MRSCAIIDSLMPIEDEKHDRTSRRQARILAMQALYQWEVQPEKHTELLSEFLAEQEVLPAVSEYAVELVQTFWNEQASIDSRIASTSSQWNFSRISLVERNVLRVAVVELTTDKVPAKAAINEAIEIAREFGGADSPRFVNGVLDEVLRKL